MNCNNEYECGYINKPYTNLRPFTCFTPCPRFSCPQFNHLPNCGYYPNLNPCCKPYERPCQPPFNPCQPINQPCFSPRDLLFFMGGYSTRKHRCQPCENRRILPGQD